VSINPPSDIVLDVARASDPREYRAAVDRLKQLGGAEAATDASAAGASAATESFSVPLPASAQTTSQPAQTQTAPETAGSEPAASNTASAQFAAATKGASDNSKSAAAYQKFEAFLLQTFVEAMLPKDASEVYGSGTAGDIWRSMFAEHIANELAESAKLGIATRISENRNRS
jgi:flagellar protein FlgJ